MTGVVLLQDGELRRQLHDRQTRISALSDKQVPTQDPVSPGLDPALPRAEEPLPPHHSEPSPGRAEGSEPGLVRAADGAGLGL